MKVHFVYAGSPFSKTESAPVTTTKHVYEMLVGLGHDVAYYDWKYSGPVISKGDDVLLGHPSDTFGPANELVSRDLKRKILMFPFHHRLEDSNMWADKYVAKADVVIAKSGKYWFDTLSESAFAHWAPKMVRVDNAIDAEVYTHVKDVATRKSKPTCLAISDMRPEKGVKQLLEIASKIDFPLTYVGHMSQEYIKMFYESLSDFTYYGRLNLSDNNVARKLCDECDIFINASLSDANPSTILEMAARGLPVISSRTSGYVEGEPVFRVFDGWHEAQRAYSDIAAMSDREYSNLSFGMREIVEEKFNWERFLSTVEGVLNEQCD